MSHIHIHTRTHTHIIIHSLDRTVSCAGAVLLVVNCDIHFRPGGKMQQVMQAVGLYDVSVGCVLDVYVYVYDLVSGHSVCVF
ncbi:hypothetical protein EON63_19655 [archaeon]|nr:MAG: hypothetical protein EON63_19655 [archaeon]